MGTPPIVRRIGVISDTHIPSQATRVPDAAMRLFAGADLILHAGDLSVLSALNQLQEIAPVYAVHGNVESPQVLTTLPAQREIEIGGCRIGMIHNLGRRASYAATARQEFPQARVVVFGHSHTPLIEDIAEESGEESGDVTGGLLLLNPGSATDRRRQPVCTVAILTLTIDERGAPHAQLHELP